MPTQNVHADLLFSVRRILLNHILYIDLLIICLSSKQPTSKPLDFALELADPITIEKNKPNRFTRVKLSQYDSVRRR